MERIVVGYDDGPAARAALTWAIHEATRRPAELVVVNVLSSIWEWELTAVQINTDRLRAERSQLLRGAWTEAVRESGVRYQTQLEVGRPADAILTAARHHDAALIVIGMTGRGTLGELVYSSVGHQLSHQAVRPIVTVPSGWRPANDDGGGAPSTRSTP